MFVKRDNERGNCPKNRNKFQAHLYKDHEHIYLGIYTTTEEAFQVYKQTKESYIKEVANEYKLLIQHELYEAMMNYKVEITD